MIGITLLEQVGPAFKCMYQNYSFHDKHDNDDDIAINFSAMCFNNFLLQDYTGKIFSYQERRGDEVNRVLLHNYKKELH